MSILSGQVEEYENVAYDTNGLPSPAFVPFQNGISKSIIKFHFAFIFSE